MDSYIINNKWVRLYINKYYKRKYNKILLLFGYNMGKDIFVVTYRRLIKI